MPGEWRALRGGSFELQFMHIPLLRIYCWKLLFSLSTLYMGSPIPVFRDEPVAESVCPS